MRRLNKKERAKRIKKDSTKQSKKKRIRKRETAKSDKILPENKNEDNSTAKTKTTDSQIAKKAKIYLKKWKKSKDWKFNKNLQNKIFVIATNEKILKNKYFRIFLKYIEKSNGNCRNLLRIEMEKILENSKSVSITDKITRAKQILKILTIS
ncbi:hypothetical protein MHBO_004628 [Bonamia ostreae]|uniref:WKF domain-containing protein n=1 Tax=Bonamia ostreae TaxID=126728 RepID=A0ABV2ATV6_9EUKA